MDPIPLVDEARLAALIDDPTWTRGRWDERAACAHIDLTNDPYFPEDADGPPVGALARCARCPVACECLATALIHEADDGLRFGWWGGYSPDARAALAERLGLPSQPVDDEPQGPADLARFLRAQQLTIPAIAAELGCTERTVYRYLASAAA